MADQVTNYQCPNCTGPLHFDSATGKLTCDYCGSSFAVADIEKMYAQKDAQAAEAAKEADAKKERDRQAAGQFAEEGDWDYSGLSGDWGADAGKMKAYNCPSCGAELVCEETTGATSCPYCGNPTIVPGTFSGMLRPDYVIPFKLDKEAAKAALKQHYKGKHFVPGTFTSNNQIEKIQGIYVPFWMFDGQAKGWVDFEATRSRTFTRGDDEITEIEHFDVHREGWVAFEKVPVDGSGKMPDDYMDSVEPYNYADLVPFSNAYLPGYLADKYDVTAEESAKRADDRCEASLVKGLEDTVKGYQTVAVKGRNISLLRGNVHYALLPVWILNTKWNGQDFLFIMNGQTGKMVGDIPVSKGKFYATFAVIACALMVLMSTIYLYIIV